MSVPEVDFTALLKPIAIELLGPPNPAFTKDTELRWGSKGARVAYLDSGQFLDNEDKFTGGTLDLIMREVGCDKAGALRWMEDHGHKERDDRQRKFYDYRDEAGEIRYKVERRKPRIPPFLPYAPDGSGGFHTGKGCMAGIPPLLYRLPELIAAPPSEIVFICEGEKDADRLAQLGFVATTNSGGAGKFPADQAKHLTERRVVVMEDDDPAGRNHVIDVAGKLSGKVAGLAILRLPGLPEKGDVSDWLDAGNTVADLRQLAAAALEMPQPVAEQPVRRGGLAGAISATDLMAKRFEPVRYVVTGLLAEGATLFGGKPKIGKSWLAYDIAIAIASGRPLFGSLPVEQGDVLYLALEDSERRLKSRLLKKGVTAPARLTLAIEWPNLDNGCIAELEAWADSVAKPVAIIIDVLKMVRGTPRSSEPLYDADYRALAGLAAFARLRSIAVLVVHHVRKMEADDPLESLSGTNGLTGAADTVMVLKRDIGTPNCILYVRGRDVEESEKAVRFNSPNGTWELLGNADEVGRTNERAAILSALRASPNPLSAREVSDVLGKNYDAVRKTMTRMTQAGEISKSGRSSYTCPNCPNVPNNNKPDIGTHGTGYMSSGAKESVPESEEDPAVEELLGLRPSSRTVF